MVKEIAGAVANGLRNTPALMAIVVLNVIAIGVAAYTLRGIAEDARANRDQLLQMVERCLTDKQDRP